MTEDRSDHTYRKRPLIVEAFQMTSERQESNVDWPQWLHYAWNKDPNEEGCLHRVNGILCLQMLDNRLTVFDDDWIVLGVDGELYPCSPSAFDKTYDRVGEDDPPPPGPTAITLPAGSLTQEEIEQIQNRYHEPLEIIARSDIEADSMNYEYYRKVAFAAFKGLGLCRTEILSLSPIEAGERILQALRALENQMKIMSEKLEEYRDAEIDLSTRPEADA